MLILSRGASDPPLSERPQTRASLRRFPVRPYIALNTIKDVFRRPVIFACRLKSSFKRERKFMPKISRHCLQEREKLHRSLCLTIVSEFRGDYGLTSLTCRVARSLQPDAMNCFTSASSETPPYRNHQSGFFRQPVRADGARHSGMVFDSHAGDHRRFSFESRESC